MQIPFLTPSRIKSLFGAQTHNELSDWNGKQLMLPSSASHADESTAFRMTQVLKRCRFLYHSRCWHSKKPCTEESSGGGGDDGGAEVTVVMEPTTRLWYLLPHGLSKQQSQHSFASKSCWAPAGRKMSKFITSHRPDRDREKECSVMLFVMLCQITLRSEHTVWSETVQKHYICCFFGAFLSVYMLVPHLSLLTPPHTIAKGHVWYSKLSF